MDIEQLKLILETAQAAGEGARDIFFWWLAYKFVGDIMELTLLIMAGTGAVKLARYLIDKVSV